MPRSVRSDRLPIDLVPLALGLVVSVHPVSNKAVAAAIPIAVCTWKALQGRCGHRQRTNWHLLRPKSANPHAPLDGRG